MKMSQVFESACDKDDSLLKRIETTSGGSYSISGLMWQIGFSGSVMSRTIICPSTSALAISERSGWGQTQATTISSSWSYKVLSAFLKEDELSRLQILIVWSTEHEISLSYKIVNIKINLLFWSKELWLCHHVHRTAGLLCLSKSWTSKCCCQRQQGQSCQESWWE